MIGTEVENGEVAQGEQREENDEDTPQESLLLQLAEIYYYLIETNQEPDLTKVHYTEHEKQGNFKLEKIPLNSAIEILEKNIPNHDMNQVITPDMITAIRTYLDTKE